MGQHIYEYPVQRLYWAANIRLPAMVRTQIEQKTASEQATLSARGEAQAISVQGAALRANPESLRLRTVEKRNGESPKVTGGATPLVDIA